MKFSKWNCHKNTSKIISYFFEFNKRHKFLIFCEQSCFHINFYMFFHHNMYIERIPNNNCRTIYPHATGMACIVWPMPPIFWTQSGQWTLRPLHSIHHPEPNADVHQHVPKRNMRQHHHQPSFQIKQVDLSLRVWAWAYVKCGPWHSRLAMVPPEIPT